MASRLRWVLGVLPLLPPPPSNHCRYWRPASPVVIVALARQHRGSIKEGWQRAPVDHRVGQGSSCKGASTWMAWGQSQSWMEWGMRPHTGKSPLPSKMFLLGNFVWGGARGGWRGRDLLLPTAA